MTYRRADDELFGKYCYIDTPWIAGKHTIYRIIRSGVRSNSWCEVPINGLTKKVNHGELTEDIVFVMLDTLIDEDAEIIRVALKDIEIIGEAEQTEPRLEQFRVGLEYHTDATHFGKLKGESVATNKTEPTTEDCSMVDDEDLGVPYVEVNGKDADCPWK